MFGFRKFSTKTEHGIAEHINRAQRRRGGYKNEGRVILLLSERLSRRKKRMSCFIIAVHTRFNNRIRNGCLLCQKKTPFAVFAILLATVVAPVFAPSHAFGLDLSVQIGRESTDGAFVNAQDVKGETYLFLPAQADLAHIALKAARAMSKFGLTLWVSSFLPPMALI